MTQRQTTDRATCPPQALGDVLTAVRSWPSTGARAWTLDALAGASRNLPIQAIVVSGSAIRAVDHSDDLDVVLVYRGRRPGLPRPPIDVDLRQYEQADVARKLKAGHDYLSWTVRYGRVLFERNGWWSLLRANWNHRLVLPSATEARERANRTQRLYDEMRTAGDHDAAAELSVSMLTHLARAALSDAGVLPQSRPELVDQLRRIDEHPLADRLAYALAHRYG